MRHSTLIVPGLRNSEVAHWQTWFESQIPARRVSGIDWQQPCLEAWTAALIKEVDAATHTVWLVAHSFGCLASVAAVAQRADKVAGAFLVAPADPWRFVANGLRSDLSSHSHEPSIELSLPRDPLSVNTVVVASSNDPWQKITMSAYWAQRWGSHFINIGDAGHINTESGFGPWPEGLALFEKMRTAQDELPLGDFSELGDWEEATQGINPHTQFLQNQLWRAVLQKQA